MAHVRQRYEFLEIAFKRDKNWSVKICGIEKDINPVVPVVTKLTIFTFKVNCDTELLTTKAFFESPL